MRRRVALKTARREGTVPLRIGIPRNVGRSGCRGHTVKNGLLFHKAGESTKDSSACFTCQFLIPYYAQDHTFGTL